MRLFEKANMFKTRTERILEKIRPAKKPSPTLPQKITKTQAQILEAAIERGEVIGGSFAQKTLYPRSRKFQDIDIISRNPKETTAYIQSKVKVPTTSQMGRHGKYTIKHKTSGKVLADVVPSYFYKKYIRQYGEIPTYNVSGVRVLREDVLYREKLGAIKYGNPKIRGKVLKDIKYLSKP